MAGGRHKGFRRDKTFWWMVPNNPLLELLIAIVYLSFFLYNHNCKYICWKYLVFILKKGISCLGECIKQKGWIPFFPPQRQDCKYSFIFHNYLSVLFWMPRLVFWFCNRMDNKNKYAFIDISANDFHDIKLCILP